MGLSLMVYGLLALSGGALFYTRRGDGVSEATPDRAIACQGNRPAWLRPTHYVFGGILVTLVLLLLGIGVVGTLGEFGRLGHSVHLPAGLVVVSLTLASAWSATRISPARPWARKVHLTLNGILLIAFVLVTATGWQVVQKYL